MVNHSCVQLCISTSARINRTSNSHKHTNCKPKKLYSERSKSNSTAQRTGTSQRAKYPIVTASVTSVYPSGAASISWQIPTNELPTIYGTTCPPAGPNQEQYQSLQGPIKNNADIFAESRHKFIRRQTTSVKGSNQITACSRTYLKCSFLSAPKIVPAQASIQGLPQSFHLVGARICPHTDQVLNNPTFKSYGRP
jgi:hypothetical protein